MTVIQEDVRTAVQASGSRRSSLVAWVHGALVHLHDPGYLQTHPLARRISVDQHLSSESAGKSLRRTLIETIEQLKPEPDGHPHAHETRRHQILRLRYVEGLAIEAIQARLAISKAEYYREHRRGVDAIASLLAERLGVENGTSEEANGILPLSRLAVEHVMTDRVRAAHAGHLPIPLDSFIGREHEQASLVALIGGRHHECRLVTLTGPPGAGKTRLALEAAADAGHDFPNAVTYVPLAPVRDHNLVLATLAQALGVREAAGQRPIESLKKALRHKAMLLVIDNFEQVVDAAPQIAELLIACPRLVALVTSRVRLHVRGEHNFPVPPLALPGGESAFAENHFAEYAAVQLFMERAHGAKPDFRPGGDDLRIIAQVCRRLDGLPLAIELAAAHIRLLSLASLLERLNTRLPLLTGGPRDLPERQQTLERAIDWSYDLLTDDERRLLRLLGVFVGGCTLEAIEEIEVLASVNRDSEDAPFLSPVPVLDGVASLADKSLIRLVDQREEAASPTNSQSPTPNPQPPRVLLLETIREYALKRLEASGEAGPVRLAHAMYYLSLAEQAEPELSGPQQVAWMWRLDADHGNFRAALNWFMAHGEVEHALRLGGALTRFWEVRGYISEGRSRLSALLSMPGASTSTSVRAKALDGAGVLAMYQTDYSEASLLYEESLSISRSLCDTRSAARSLIYLGWMAHDQGRYAASRRLVEEGLALCREAGDRRGVARALSILAMVAHELDGDFDAARLLSQESLTLNREIGDLWGIGWALDIVARSIAPLTGYGEQSVVAARANIEESLAIWRALGERRQLAYALNYLGHLQWYLGNTTEAHTRLLECLVIFDELGDKDGIAQSLTRLAGIAAAASHPVRAARLAGAFDTFFEAQRVAKAVWCQPLLGSWLAPAREALTVAAWATAYAEGQAMTVEQAVAYAQTSEDDG